MTTSKCYVWTWLPGATDPVVAGELRSDDKGRQMFVYGRSYLDRENAVPIYEPELPLRCDQIGMAPSTVSQLRRRAVLNPDIFSGCEDLNPKDW